MRFLFSILLVVTLLYWSWKSNMYPRKWEWGGYRAAWCIPSEKYLYSSRCSRVREEAVDRFMSTWEEKRAHGRKYWIRPHLLMTGSQSMAFLKGWTFLPPNFIFFYFSKYSIVFSEHVQLQPWFPGHKMQVLQRNVLHINRKCNCFPVGGKNKKRESNTSLGIFKQVQLDHAGNEHKAVLKLEF